MHALIETRRSELAELCRRFHVRRLELFGSAAREDFDPARSDVDLLVEFERDPAFNRFDNYFGFKAAVEALLGRPVDLVTASAVRNPYLRASIDRTKEPLYGA
ncbi:MAG: nucleotidyltransferase domain-containing protein [Chloroflexi bacterium]|nr:nucleotidyltransferase domain-containing protein [Chloroflexota bacterium]